MLLFAHLGIALAAARPLKAAALSYVLVGSMLPDIIDKPLGEMIFGTPAMGRTVCHTLLFLMLLSAAAFLRQDLRLASLSGGVAVHFILDFMWNSPSILLWPLLGAFPQAENLSSLDYLRQLLMGLMDPAIALPEFLGFSYLFYYALLRRAEISSQIRLKLQGIPMLPSKHW